MFFRSKLSWERSYQFFCYNVYRHNFTYFSLFFHLLLSRSTWYVLKHSIKNIPISFRSFLSIFFVLVSIFKINRRNLMAFWWIQSLFQATMHKTWRGPTSLPVNAARKEAKGPRSFLLSGPPRGQVKPKSNEIVRGNVPCIVQRLSRSTSRRPFWSNESSKKIAQILRARRICVRETAVSLLSPNSRFDDPWSRHLPAKEGTWKKTIPFL